MSKLIDLYKSLKEQDSNTLYLFKSGIFFIFIDADAITVSPILNLKLTFLNQSTQKCGFPINSLDKYLRLLENTPYKIKLIDDSSNVSYNIRDFNINKNSVDLLTLISTIDVENLSVKEAYDFISNIKESAEKILKEVNLDE